MKTNRRHTIPLGILTTTFLLVILLTQLPAQALPYQTADQPWVQFAKLTPSSPVDGTWLGFSVAISDKTAVAGASHAVQDEVESGAVFLYEKGLSWADSTETAQLTPSNGDDLDLFGHAVAADAGVVVVGAPGKDAADYNSGLVYIFEKPVDGWPDTTEIARLAPSDPADGGMFGAAVDIAGDTIVVGAPHLEAMEPGKPGAAYIFVRPPGGWVDQTETAKIQPSDGASYDGFGFSTAISDGTIAVGAPFDDDNGRSSGSAYAYVKPEDGWTSTIETAKLTPSNGVAYDWFGRSLAVSGSNIFVGAPQTDAQGRNAGTAYLFTMPETGWTNMSETARLSASDGAAGNLFGWSVAIDGPVAAAGAPFASGSSPTGQAYIFQQPITGWAAITETAKLLPSDASPLDRFGISLAGSGKVFLIGADVSEIDGADSGSAYLFAQTGTIEISKYTLPDGGEGFNFSHDIPGDNDDFTLDDAQTKTFLQVPCGVYNVTETDPAPEFDLTALECTDSDEDGDSSITDISTGTAAIHLDPGETVSCRFENTKQGIIQVGKTTIPAGEPDQFSFSLSGGPENLSVEFSLTGEDPPFETYLKPGNYAVQEIPLEGWQLHTAVCDNGDFPTSITLPPGGAITCTFTNHQHFNIHIPISIHTP